MMMIMIDDIIHSSDINESYKNIVCIKLYT